jgi:hypothetical protein
MRPWAPAVAVVAAGGAMLAFAGSSSAAVATVSGGAFGEQVNATITDVGSITSGPTPTVTLPSSGGSFMQSAASAAVGPAGLFLTSGALNVATEGTTGASGTVTSAASVANPNVLQTLTATSVASGCRSTEAGTTGSTTIAGGVLVQSAASTIQLPPNPAPNTSIDGVNDGEGGTGDQFTVILNQQSTTNGVLTVNAVNFVLRGPTATGNVILGQTRCGVSATAASTTTTRAGATTTTRVGTITTSGGTGTASGTDTALARTGGEAPPLVPTAAVVVMAVGASCLARRRLGKPAQDR